MTREKKQGPAYTRLLAAVSTDRANPTTSRMLAEATGVKYAMASVYLSTFKRRGDVEKVEYARYVRVVKSEEATAA